jgi:von Willebrand factor type A domain
MRMVRNLFSALAYQAVRQLSFGTSSSAHGTRSKYSGLGVFMNVALLGAALAPALSACGSEEDKGGATITRPSNPPCQNELVGDCGEACEDDDACGTGLYCKGGECTADCTTDGAQCMGTCSDRGRCDGTIKTVTEPVVNPDQGIDIGGIGGGGGAGAACATGSSEAKLANVNMFLMFDQSSSMLQNDRWSRATAALVQFLQSPETSGIKIALRFFASDEPAAGCNIQECNIDACSQPLVELGALTEAGGGADPQEATLVDAIESREPNPEGPGTPISAALQGAMNWSMDFNASAPETERAVVVFVTDGEPSGCEQGTNQIAAIAAEGLDADVLTFAVGLEGSPEDLMNAIAREGGTDEAIFVGDGNAEEDLLEALNAIRGKAMSCEFDLPNTATVDPSKVNVTLSIGDTEEQWNKVNNAGECGTSKAWHYDSESNPTSVVLCPSACDVASSTPGARIDVVFGCETGKPVTR